MRPYVAERVAAATRAHEADWSPARTMRAEAALKLIRVDDDNGYSLLRPDSFPDFVTKHNEAIMTYVRLVDQSGLMSRMSPDGEIVISGRAPPHSEANTNRLHLMTLHADDVRTAARMRWAEAWHTKMREPGAGRRYENLSHRLDALRQLPDAAFVDAPAPWAPTLGVFRTDWSGGDPAPLKISPGDWIALKDADEAESNTNRCHACDVAESADCKFQICSGSSVAKYCSFSCQKEHWTRAEGGHKKECKLFREVSKGKGAE